MGSLPPISAPTRLIQFWLLRGLGASLLIRNPTSREPVKDTKRVLGCSTRRSPIEDPLPVHNEKLRRGNPASRSTSANFWAIVGVSLEGLITTVLPATRAASVIPVIMASGIFHGGITMPAPNGR